MPTESIFSGIGAWTAIVAACVLLAVTQSFLLVVIGYFCKRIWKRVTRTYDLHVVAYWLNEQETKGLRRFDRAESSDKEKM